MKHVIKRLTMMALGLCMALSLAGCDLAGIGGITAKDAQNYVQGRLDMLYHGVYNKEYLDFWDDFTEADAKEMHDSNMQLEAEYFMSWLYMKDMTDEHIAKAEAVVRAIYAKSSYEVGKAENLSGGSYAVPVKIYPIDIMVNMTDDVLQGIWKEVENTVDLDAVSKMSDVQYDEMVIQLSHDYNAKVLDAVEALIPSLGYGKEQSLLLQLSLDEDDYYTISDNDWENLDYMMIDYFGSYQ